MMILPILFDTLSEDVERSFMEALWQEYRHYMFSVARRYIQEPTALEDIVSDSLMKLMEHVDVLKRLSHPQLFAYIRQTVRSRATDHLRRNGREAKLHRERVDLAWDVDWQHIELEEELNALWDAVSLLPENEQRVLRLKYSEKLDDVKIASAMAVSESTVRRYLRSARTALKNALYEDGGTQDGR